MAESRVAGELRPPEPPPEANQPGFVVWARNNLFNSIGNSLLTVVLAAVVVLAVKGLLGFLFSDARLWRVIPPNSANYAVLSYPREHLTRIWVSFDVVMFLIGASLMAWRPKGTVAVSRIVAGVRSLGVAIAFVGLLAPGTFGGRGLALIVGLVLILVGVAAPRVLGENRLAVTVPVLRVVVALAVLLLIGLWLLPIASTTKVPFTISFLVALAGYGVARAIVRPVREQATRRVLSGLWLLMLPVVYLHIERDPQIAWSTLVGDWLPWIVGIGLVGVAAILATSRLGREPAAVVNALLVIAAIGSWLLSMPMVARMLLLGLVVVSLSTPTFGAGQRGRVVMIGVWLALLLLATYVFAVAAAENGLATRNEYLGGLNLTMMLAIGGMLLSFPLGIALALARTSSMPIFRLLATGYIEAVRGVPLITVLFMARFGILNFLPKDLQIDANILVLGAITLFSGAYLAENVRGGLQSINKGQYEASKALGMTTSQMTLLITLPQALRAVIPAIVGQVISLFKDTSLVAIVGLADFFRVANNIVPGQADSLGSKIENLFLAAAVYWVFTFTFSRASQRLERRLGVGTR